MATKQKKATGTKPAAAGAVEKKVRISKWYPADDAKVIRRSPVKTPKAIALRKNITPGQVLILLVGRFKGKRVVFLKQLKSGLLLVTGPYKVNGVPLRRVNQSTVIPTTTKVDVSGAKLDSVTDDYFRRIKAKKTKKSEEAFFANTAAEKSEEEKKQIADKKKVQVDIDTPLLAGIKKTELLRQYLKSRFTLSKNTKPHELVF